MQEYLKELLENTDQKLLVFAHHKELLDGVEFAMNKCALLCPQRPHHTALGHFWRWRDVTQLDITHHSQLGQAMSVTSRGRHAFSSHLIASAAGSWHPGTSQVASRVVSSIPCDVHVIVKQPEKQPLP